MELVKLSPFSPHQRVHVIWPFLFLVFIMRICITVGTVKGGLETYSI